ncbi:hypothetical protein Tco_0873140 [Tanacetum coccineum]
MALAGTLQMEGSILEEVRDLDGSYVSQERKGMVGFGGKLIQILSKKSLIRKLFKTCQHEILGKLINSCHTNNGSFTSKTLKIQARSTVSRTGDLGKTSSDFGKTLIVLYIYMDKEHCRTGYAVLWLEPDSQFLSRTGYAVFRVDRIRSFIDSKSTEKKKKKDRL